MAFFNHLYKAFNNWQSDDGDLVSASIAYYAALSFFPLMLLLIAGMGLFFKHTHSGQNAKEQIYATIAAQTSAELTEQIKEPIENAQENASLGGPIGLVTLLLAATLIFAQFERGFNRIWNVEEPEWAGVVGAIKNVVFNRLRAFLGLLGVGVLVVLVFIANMVLAGVRTRTEELLPTADWIWWLVQLVVSVGLNTLVLGLLFKVMPKGEVYWSEALRGGALAAVVWEIGRQALAVFLIGNKYTSAYGVVGSLIALMLWVYYATAVLLIAAEYVQVICSERRTAAASSEKA